jgi:hypothetical protein
MCHILTIRGGLPTAAVLIRRKFARQDSGGDDREWRSTHLSRLTRQNCPCGQCAPAAGEAVAIAAATGPARLMTPRPPVAAPG